MLKRTPSLRAMNQDADVYGDPENFRPERFLDETETMENIPINTHGEVMFFHSLLASRAHFSLEGSHCLRVWQT